MRSADFPLYNILMILCLLTSATQIVKVLSSLRDTPITGCVLALVPACSLSQLSHGQAGLALNDGFTLAKILAHYTLLVALVNTPARLRSFLIWLTVFTLLMVTLAMLHYHGFINIESLEAVKQIDVDAQTGEITFIPRLRSTGVFNDPNDLSMMTVFGLVVCVYLFETTPAILPRIACVVTAGVLLEALRLTFSRGGLINLAFSMLILCGAKFGRKATIAAALLGLPLALVVFGGRQTRINVNSSGDTSQDRIQLWVEGMNMFKESPIFGTGMNTYAERAGLVAHNSFVHTYGELGLFGGTMFAGAWSTALWGVLRLGKSGVAVYDHAVRNLQPFFLAIVSSYMVGMLSLSRPYTITTYVLLAQPRLTCISPTAELRFPLSNLTQSSRGGSWSSGWVG